jgi:iron(III) transport system ATP-binding protein
MTAIALRHVSKRFDGVLAIDDISLEGSSGAFLALLGPSGCGKTTLLRLLAGFERPSEGAVSLDGMVVSDGSRHVPPEERRVSMVFQSYALWPHMTVAENVAYPLATARVPRPERAAQVAAALAQVGLETYAERRPDALSGGQRQRVALARTLVQDARLVLCDEPLANLDVHLRAATIETFRRLHRETGRTFVYVTHDQAEALALATAIAVLDRGRLAQVGSPETVYAEPASEAVAAFVGRGALLDVELLATARGSGLARLGDAEFAVRARPDTRPGPARLLVRPENVRPGGPLTAAVTGSVFRGAAHEVAVSLGGQTLLLDLPARPEPGAPIGLAIEKAWVVPPG